MKSIIAKMPCTLFVALLTISTGCMTASVDRGSAKAQTGAPEAASVEILSIPYDPNYPVYVVAVEPLDYAASDIISGQGAQEAPDHRGGVAGFGGGLGSTHSSRDRWDRELDSREMDYKGNKVGGGMAMQLLTALANSGNIQVIELSSLKRDSDGKYSCELEEGEIGPFIVRGSVTEFNETADLSGSKKGGSLGRLGAGAALLGAVTDNRTLTHVGAGVAIADPRMEKGDTRRSGMVGMDLRIVNGENGRIVGAFDASGTFTTISSVSGVSVFGIGSSGSEFAASALGQATRAAMNEAVQKATINLKNRVRVR